MMCALMVVKETELNRLLLSHCTTQVFIGECGETTEGEAQMTPSPIPQCFSLPCPVKSLRSECFDKVP